MYKHPGMLHTIIGIFSDDSIRWKKLSILYRYKCIFRRMEYAGNLSAVVTVLLSAVMHS